MTWKEFKARGGNWIFILIGLGIAAAIVYYGMKADTPHKIIGFSLLAASTFFFFSGDSLFGAAKKPDGSKGQGSYWLWVLCSYGTAAFGLATLFVW